MKWKIIILTTIIYSIIIGCSKTEEIPEVITITNPQPGLAQILISPQNNQYADLIFNVFGGTPYSTVECRYAITAYLDPTVVNFLPLFLYRQLDANGATTMPVSHVQCSTGLLSSAFVEWSCRSTFPPYQEAYPVNAEGNSFFFDCPIS